MQATGGADVTGSAVSPGRRAVLHAGLVVAGAALLAGCGVDIDDIRWDDDRPVPSPTPGPDELARRRAVESAQALLSACVAAAGTAPAGARPVLDAVARQHSEHLVAFGATPHETPAVTEPATTTPSGAGGTPTPGTDPLGDLAGSHTAAASQAMTDTSATSGPLARLLAQVAAARAVQARQVAAALGQPVPDDPVPVPSKSTVSPSATASSSATAPTSSTGSATLTSTATESAPLTGSATAPLKLGDAAVRAVTRALKGEQAAVYGYEALTVWLQDPARQQALAATATHASVIEQLESVLRRADAPVPPAAPAYRLPMPLTGAPEAMALAARLESSLAALDADLVAASEADLRAVAVDLLLHRALAAHHWGSPPTAFPGG